MNLYKYLKIYLFILFASNSTQCQRVTYAPGLDFNLFQHTSAYLLAKAVETEDTAAIRRYVTEDSIPIDCKEPKFGNTLLLLAIVNNKELSSKKLLELGANPNASSFEDSSPFLAACHYEFQLKYPQQVLVMLIDYGADVNSVQLDTTNDQFGKKQHFRTTPLGLLCSYGSLNSVKVLVEHGINLDAYGKNSESILSSAVLSEKLDILKYLMIEKKAPIPDYVVKREPGTRYEREMTISDLLNEHDYSGDSQKQALKEEILSYLKKQHKA